MNHDLAVVLGLLVSAIVMFAVNNPRMDAVALLMLTALPFTGVITIGESLSGFSDPNIVLLGALFVIGEGLVRTGVARNLGDWLMRTAGTSETQLLVLLMVVVGALGAFMSSTGVVAIFIPVALRIAHATKTSPSRLMMPLSFAALISGMMTLVATAPNLVVNSELVRGGFEGFDFFSFTPFGIPILLLGIIYMIFARRWLPATPSAQDGGGEQASMQTWIERYRLASREYRFRVGANSELLGKTLDRIDLRTSAGVNLIAIERTSHLGTQIVNPTSLTTLEAADVLFVDIFAPAGELEPFLQRFQLEPLPLSGSYFTDRTQEIGMAEVMVSADSDLLGKTIVEAGFRTRYRLNVIGIRRGKKAIEGGLLSEKMRIGDTLLLIGSWKKIDRLSANSRDLVLLNLPSERAEVLTVTGKAPHALACLLVMVGLMVSGIVPNVQAALIACLLMGALRCIDLDSAYRSIHWKSLILIVGMLPFSIALERTGGVELAADFLVTATAGTGITVVLACLFLITAVLGLFISNTATAVLMAPVALAVASSWHASPYPFAMIVALGASTAFMTPISSPVNTLVVAPGGYRFVDFVRVGVPFSILVMVVSVFLVPLILPLYPK